MGRSWKKEAQNCAFEVVRITFAVVKGAESQKMFQVRPLGEYRATLQLAIPLVIGQLGQIILAFADSAMVGHYGVKELAAASFCVNLFNLPIIFLMGYSYGLLPALGRSYGSFVATGEVVRAGVRNIFLISVGVLLLMLLPLAFLEAFKQPAELHGLIVTYYVLMLISLPFVGVFNALKQFFDSQGVTWIPMVALLAANALNIFGNYVLIFGAWGCPELGLLGAGLATLFSRILEVLILAFVYLRHLHKRRFARYREKLQRVREPILRRYELYRNGGGMGLQMGLETAMFSISVIFVGWMGEVALAAHHVAVTVQTLGFMTYYGLGGAISIRVSRFMGQGQSKRALIATNIGFRLLMLSALTLGGLLWGFRTSIAGLFSTSPEVIELASLLLVVGIAYQPADALQVCYSNALRGLGDAWGLMLTAFVAYFGIGLPLSYILCVPVGLGALGVWLGYPVGLLGAGLMYAWRFYRTVYRHKNEIFLSRSRQS